MNSVGKLSTSRSRFTWKKDSRLDEKLESEAKFSLVIQIFRRTNFCRSSKSSAVLNLFSSLRCSICCLSSVSSRSRLCSTIFNSLFTERKTEVFFFLSRTEGKTNVFRFVFRSLRQLDPTEIWRFVLVVRKNVRDRHEQIRLSIKTKFSFRTTKTIFYIEKQFSPIFRRFSSEVVAILRVSRFWKNEKFSKFFFVFVKKREFRLFLEKTFVLFHRVYCHRLLFDLSLRKRKISRKSNFPFISIYDRFVQRLSLSLIDQLKFL